MKSTVSKIGLFAVSLFGFVEVIILFGIQFFWIIYKGDLVPVENTWDLLAIIVSFIMVYIVGILCRIEKYREIFRQIEWLIHLLLCTCYLTLFILLQTRDEFNPFIPFTWLFFFWNIIIGLVLISSIVSNLDKPSLLDNFQDKNKLLLFFGISAIIWLVTLGIISILRYPVYFWIFSCIFHALMIPISISRQHTINLEMKNPESYIAYQNFKDMIFRKVNQDQLPKKEKKSTICSRHFRLLFLVFLIFLALNQWGFYHQAMGSIEDNYYLVVQIFLSPLFYVGFGLAILSVKLKNPVIGDCIGLLIIALSIVEIYIFAPLALGYALLTLIFIVNKLSPTSYASSLIAIQLAWVLGLLLFTFNGMLLTIAEAIRFYLQADITLNYGIINLFLFEIIGIIFCIYLGFFILEKFLGRKDRIQTKIEAVPKAIEKINKDHSINHSKQRIKELSIRKGSIILLIIIFGGLFTPFIVLSFTTKGPPLTYPEKKKIELEDFCGTALAGYTNKGWEYNNLTKLGVHWLRVHFSWRSIEVRNDHYNFSRWDTYVKNCTKYNIKIIAMLNYPPSWLNLSTENYVPPKYLNLYLEFVNKTVRRYKENISAWEIWNEPNLERFWDGPIEHYYDLFEQTVDLIHDIDPDLYILGGSLSAAASGWMPSNLDDMFKLGIMKNVDAISIHFYSFDPDTLYQGIKQYVIIGEKYGFTGDYLITEIGNPTSGTYPHMVSMEKLAENVIKKMVIASALQIKTFIWYCTRDSGDKDADLRDSERWFGLLYNNYTWKKAAYAFSLFSKFCSNSEYRPDLINKKGGISATDLMVSLYRQEDGTSTLIMWYAPTVYESGTIKVTLDISDIKGDILIHNIYNGNNKTLKDNFVEVGDAPVFLTFKAKDISDSITLQVQESIISVAIYISLFGIFIASICFAVVIHQRNKQRNL
ncbi:MAG: GH39 family glycosyl hydrolase [Promethearchaeota archaeon]